jgi:hypothetical protein
LIGLVAVSNDAALVGTMTSGGTDVIEMPASTSPSTTVAAPGAVVGGGSVLVAVGSVGMVVVTTVAGGAETGGLGDVGATAGAVAPGPHAAAKSARATRNAFALTCRPPPEAPYCEHPLP